MTKHKSATLPRATFDPIALEVLRNRLEATIEEAASTIQRTAISPVVTEGLDFSATLLDADGRLICGGGFVKYHWWAAAHAVKSTIARYGDAIAPGDVFLANDPHTGGGLHLGDVMVQRPIFVGNKRVAWAALSSHLMDIGGMVPGSFAPAATECFQEGLRIPPVRLFRADVEVTDVWDLVRTNIRLATQGEMDLRSLVAGCHVAQERIAVLAESMGVEDFAAGIAMLLESCATEMRRRIGMIADGTYEAVNWAEWGEEFFRIPCTLVVDGERLVFDYTGTAPQAPHFFNSKLYIIESGLGQSIGWMLAPDLPFSQGLFDPMELRCPEGTVVSSIAPAPVNAAHIHVAKVAYETGVECLRLALAASPDAPARQYLTGWQAGTAMGVSTWTTVDGSGKQEVFLLQEGAKSGSSGGVGKDGIDLAWSLIGADFPTGFTDIEMWEAWYPVTVFEKRSRLGPNGTGEFRSGAGCQMVVGPRGVDHMTGMMLGIRRWLPLNGAAGGWPGATNEFLVHHADGTAEEVGAQDFDVVVQAGERFEVRSASGGGFGDPLNRDAHQVARDVEHRRIDRADAESVYGVVFADGVEPDLAATAERRHELFADRLHRSQPPIRPLSATDIKRLATEGDPLPFYPGVVQRGPVAFSDSTGAVLAIAPDHWTDGCRVLEEPCDREGPPVVIRSYLDPVSGRSLYVEAVPAGEPRSFRSSPRRWTRQVVAQDTDGRSGRRPSRSRAAGSGRAAKGRTAV